MAAPESSSSKTGFRWKWLLYLMLIITVGWAARLFQWQDLLKQVLDIVARLGSWGAALFIGIYVAAAILFIPGSILTLGAGALFGVLWGTVYVSVASTLGASGAFLIGRYLARHAIARKIEGNPRFAAIDHAVGSEGWKIVLLTRLSPIFPFTLLNYAFGLTSVKFSHYVLASWIGMMPGTVMYVYLGSLAKVASEDRARTNAGWTLYGVGLLATVIVTIIVTRIARQALANKINA